MQEGLYESLMTERLTAALALVSGVDVQTSLVDDADAPHVLARHIADLVHDRLRSTRDPHERISLVNGLVELLSDADEAVAAPATQLLSVLSPPGPGVDAISSRPATPLSESSLLTNATGEPSLGAELRAELDSANEVDLLCAFVKWHGLRLLEPELATRCAPAAYRFRVITTTYMGATERAALDRLVREFGAEVKVQYDAAAHPAARQGLDVPARHRLRHRVRRIVEPLAGALLDGVEWNVRLSSRRDTIRCWSKFRATFDTYWNDSSFEAYDPDRDRDRLDDALAEASGRDHPRSSHDHARRASRSDPFPTSRRCSTHSRPSARCTIGTATSSSPPPGPARPSSRRSTTETLCQATCERPDAAVRRPSTRDPGAVAAHLSRGAQRRLRSASCTSVAPARSGGTTSSPASSRSTPTAIDTIPSDAFDVVVIDEFHHAEAPTYRRMLDHLRPRELLGLTATPERADGVDVRTLLRRPHRCRAAALGRAGRRPACARSTTSRSRTAPTCVSVSWTRGRYDEGELSNVYTGNDARAAIVLAQLRDKVLDPGAMRALGLLRQRRPRPVHGARRSTRPASRPSRSAATHPQPTASARLTDLQSAPGQRRSSPPTCSTRASTCPTSTPCCSCAPPRAPRSSSSSSAADCAVRATRPC